MTHRVLRSSSAVGLLLTLVGLGLLARLPDMLVAVALVCVAALVLAGTTLIAAGRTPVHTGLASVCFVVAAGAAAVSVGAAALPHAGSPTETISVDAVNRMLLASVVVCAAGAAATGAIALARPDSFVRGGRSLLRIATTNCLALGASILVVRSNSPGGAVEEFLGVLPAPFQLTDPYASPALAGFLVLGGTAALALAAALSRLPVRPVTPRIHRDRVETWTLAASRPLHAVGKLAASAGVVLFLVAIGTGSDTVGALPGGVADVVSNIVEIEPLRLLFLEVTIVAGLAAALTEWVYRLGVDDADGAIDLLAGSIGGASLAGVLIVAKDDIFQEATASLGQTEVLALRLVTSNLGETTLLLGAAFAICAGLAVVLALVGGLASVGALPVERSASVLAASGLVTAAVIGGHLHEPSAALFVVVGLAVVVWDVATFGQELVREVGATATSRVAFVHAGGVLSVGLVAAVGVFWASGATASATADAPGVAGFVALLGVVLVAVGLQR